MHYHMWDTIVIMKEGNPPSHHRCFDCDMFVTWANLNHRHPTIAIYDWVSNMSRKRLAEEEERAGAETALRTYGKLLKTVMYFKYLGGLLTATYDDWPVIFKLHKAWKR